MSEFEFERATLDAKLKEYDKFVSDKLALDSWYNAEKRKIDIKEYAGGGVEQGGFRSISEIMSGADDYDSESRLAKSYKASIDNMQKNAEVNVVSRNLTSPNKKIPSKHDDSRM